MDDKLLELGLKIKELREEKNITIEELANKLIINKNLITKIEEGQKLTKDVTYIRLIVLKIYGFLNGNIDEINPLLDKVYPAQVEKTVIINSEPNNYVKKKKMKKRTKNNINLVKNSLLLIFLSLFLLFLITISYYNVKIQIKNDIKGETTILDETVLMPEKVIKPTIKNYPYKFQKTNTFNNLNLDVEKNNFLFTVKAKGKVYVEMNYNNNPLEIKTLNKNEKQDFKINSIEQLYFNIGNINNCDLYIDNMLIQKNKYQNAQQFISFNFKGNNDTR